MLLCHEAFKLEGWEECMLWVMRSGERAGGCTGERYLHVFLFLSFFVSFFLFFFFLVANEQMTRRAPSMNKILSLSPPLSPPYFLKTDLSVGSRLEQA